jgi:hypothetical protein
VPASRGANKREDGTGRAASGGWPRRETGLVPGFGGPGFGGTSVRRVGLSSGPGSHQDDASGARRHLVHPSRYGAPTRPTFARPDRDERAIAHVVGRAYGSAMP